MGATFAYTTAGSMHQNGQVERKFTTIFNCVHAILNGKKFPPFMRNEQWVDVANNAMLLKNNLIPKSRELSHFQQFFGKEKRIILTSVQKFNQL